jgi:hypothetical protein
VHRAAMIAVIAVAAVVAAAPTTTAQPSLVAGPDARPMATPPLPLYKCPIGTYGQNGGCVESPDDIPTNATAICADGVYSHSETESVTCQKHGGVAQWCPCSSASGQSYVRRELN